MILGIDLGTTCTVAATLDERGRPVALPNELGEFSTPSVVHFESASEVLVGSAARNAAVADPDNTVALVKRLMGTECDMLFHGVRHTPESISAVILRSVVAAVSDGVEPVRAVITVPAYFGIREREATFQAAKLAGVEVLELLSEPVSAALHHGTAGVAGDERAVLVYDLGGGTFDTTVLRMGSHGIEVVATDGDSRLGGADWDERVAEFLVESFARAVDGVDPHDDEVFLHDVRAVAETTKRALSRTASRTVVLRCAGATASVELDRTTLERLGSDLVDRTTAIVRRVLVSAAEKRVRRVDQVVLVGGSSRMPAIAAALAEELGIAPKLVEPDFAVAFGAAIRAHQLADDGSRADLRRAGGMLAVIADQPTSSVVPGSFGVLVEDSHDPTGLGRLVVHTVHRNTPLPAKSTTRFCTIVDDQDEIRVQVFEQAGDIPSEVLSHNRRVLDGRLTDLPPLPAGTRIEVTLLVSADGLLSLTAREPGSGASLHLEAYVDGVVDGGSADELAQALTGLTIRQ